MLREILRAWRGRNTLALMLDQFDQMLTHDAWMFKQATDTYWHKLDWHVVQDPLYGRDRQVNALERSIRREVVRHLTVHPGKDVVACLILMSVVKDAERIGDYCKNIFEVGKMFRHENSAPTYLDPLREIEGEVMRLFDQTREAFRESNEHLAREIQKGVGQAGKRCDHLIEKLLHQDDSLSSDEAVSYGMMARHMKRIAAHLSNIASSVIAPVENLDFMDERHRPSGELDSSAGDEA